MPGRALKLIFEWMDRHNEELHKNWGKCQKGEIPGKIKPLQ